MAGAYATRWRALVGISILSFVVFIDFSVVNTILPGIQRDLHATFDQLQWVMNAFVLMLTVFMVTMGRLGDIYGRRKVFYAGVIVYAVASLSAGLSVSPEMMIACRLVQGICGAIVLTCAVGLVNHHFDKAEQGRALAIFMSITGFAMAIGPVIGGTLMSLLSWRWGFFVNVPVVVIGFLIAAPVVQETPAQPNERVDWLGLSVLTPGMIALVVAIMKANNWGWTAPLTLAFAIAAVALLSVFVAIERRAASPIVDLTVFRSRNFLACAVIAVTLGGFISLGNFVAPLYLQTVRLEAPWVAGLMLLPISALVVLVPPLIGRLVDASGPMPFIAIGQVFLALSALAQLFFQPDSARLFVLFGLGLFGLGWGLQQATATLAATSAFAPERASTIIGILYSIWNFGSSLSLAIGGLIFEVRDTATLNGALAADNIDLSAHDQQLVRSVLSDPSQAMKALGALPSGLEAKILPMFHDAFMAGYHGAMWYLLVTCAVGAVLVPLIVGRPGAVRGGG